MTTAIKTLRAKADTAHNEMREAWNIVRDISNAGLDAGKAREHARELYTKWEEAADAYAVAYVNAN